MFGYWPLATGSSTIEVSFITFLEAARSQRPKARSQLRKKVKKHKKSSSYQKKLLISQPQNE
jgi:hypothetical protein